MQEPLDNRDDCVRKNTSVGQRVLNSMKDVWESGT
jgi:hypothetical protein